jgi:hypothetical protein
MGSAEKRIEELERRIGSRQSRLIVITIPTLLTPVEGSIESASTVTPETRAAADGLLRAVGACDADLIVEVAHFYRASVTNGGSEPEPIPAPELSVT